jgi:4-amino-4-deoxy-L-arabinose transferase-like glycosyltransferase
VSHSIVRSRAASTCGLAGLTALTVVLRLPFLGSIGPDEGGYAYVAREWAHGDRLYRTIWIDRPQGLLLAYRLLLSFGHGAAAIRAGAIVSAVLITVLLAGIGWLIDGPRLAATAASLYAVLGVGPNIEGFTFNGELAAAVPATAAVGAVALALRTRRLRWFAVAGVLGGVAVVMKQSGFDGFLVALVAALAVRADRRTRALRVALVAAGGAVPVAASVLAGLQAGWPSYWSALVGWRLGNPAVGIRIDSLRMLLDRLSSGPAREVLPLAALGVVGGILAVRRGRALPAVWLVAAFLGFNAGGLYWPHYLVQLVAPLSLLLAEALGALRRPALVALAVAVITAPTILFVARLQRLPDGRADSAVAYASGYDNDVRVARWIRRHTRAQDTIYVLESRADLYFLADREAPFPYLWSHPLHAIPGALTRLDRLLAGPARPRLVIQYQRPDRRIARILHRDYLVVWHDPKTRVPVWQARPHGRERPRRP